MLDNRDNEPAPNKGYWIEGSVRSGLGDWTFVGFNTTLRGYVPLVGENKLVGAGRVVFDGLAGDAPVRELATAGGFQSFQFLGGDRSVRGIRQARYLGRGKALAQLELRWRFVEFNIGGKVPIALTLLGFGDLGSVSTYLGDPFHGPYPGTGGGLRIAMDENFIIRADMGVSPEEGWSPGVYIDLDHLF